MNNIDTLTFNDKIKHVHAGALVDILPGDYFLVPKNEGHMTLDNVTRGILIKREGYDKQKCMGYYSALVNDGLIFVWQDRLQAVI